uniref:CSON006811 protein n=1 Tax=Culicoides sonorensis TaxID=179676 RepID=A0A336KAY4_CULSO
MDSLPKLPGLNFDGKFKQNHNVSHCFDFRNGYRIPKTPVFGVGGDPKKEDSLMYNKMNRNSILFDPILTYGCVKKPYINPFKPHFVLYDKKTLKFLAFFKQQIFESQKEHVRTRYVNIFYFLEDDTITVIEPEIDNCGFPQGKLIRRGKIKNVSSDKYYTWKNFNLGIDIAMQGFVFHITDCDMYTKEFLLSNGIELNPAECLPIDSTNTNKIIKKMKSASNFKVPRIDDKLRRYLEFQGMVLHFDCVLYENDKTSNQYITYKLFYYLEDDTIAIKELKENREGRYHFSMMMSRNRLPKNWKQLPSEFPSIFMEKSENEITDFYCPTDLRIGETIFVYGKKIILLDCDKFTRDYYERVLKLPQPNRLEIQASEKKKPKSRLPNYLGLGTPEDSMASCYGLIPKSPKKDIINYLINQNKFLRYGCVMDAEHPENQHRNFIIMYSLSNHTIKIVELASDNSGIQGGLFLSPIKIVKPDSNPDEPVYYSPKDLYIGATLHVYSHRFIITSADLYVYRYMQNFPELFTARSIQSVRNYLLLQGHLKEDLANAIEKEVLNQKLTDPIVDEPKDMNEALQSLTITGDPQNLNISSKIGDAKLSDQQPEEREICPYFIIPQKEKRESYHETCEKEYLDNPNQAEDKSSNSKKSTDDTKFVHFKDDILTQ